VPRHLALGEGKNKKKDRAFPECLGNWHLGKSLKKNEFLPRVLHSGKRFKKKREISSPSVALGEE
jgi:hypothetical protein